MLILFSAQPGLLPSHTRTHAAAPGKMHSFSIWEHGRQGGCFLAPNTQSPQCRILSSLHNEVCTGPWCGVPGPWERQGLLLVL